MAVRKMKMGQKCKGAMRSIRQEEGGGGQEQEVGDKEI
jgi:hypothetical protein